MDIINKSNILFSIKAENFYIRYHLLVNSFTNFLSIFFHSCGLFLEQVHLNFHSEHLTVFITITGCYIRYSKQYSIPNILSTRTDLPAFLLRSQQCPRKKISPIMLLPLQLCSISLNDYMFYITMYCCSILFLSYSKSMYSRDCCSRDLKKSENNDKMFIVYLFLSISIKVF
jgi:hypothetical protein